LRELAGPHSNGIKKAKAAKVAKAANVFLISPPTFCLFRQNPSGFYRALARMFHPERAAAHNR
jgi:hypothetical protein